jgi:hypothetical protein
MLSVLLAVVTLALPACRWLAEQLLVPAAAAAAVERPAAAAAAAAAPVAAVGVVAQD